MLSYMKEQSMASAAGQNNGRAAQEYLTVASRGKRVRKTTFLLLALFTMGLVSILLMIKKTSPASAGAAETTDSQTQIEKAIEHLTGIKTQVFNRMDEIINKFYEFSDVQQVGVEQLSRNPFMHDSSWGSLRKTADPTESDADAERLLREQRLKKQAKELRLLSIMHSAQGDCCMINDRILYEGDTINNFKITDIQDNSVTLLSYGSEPQNVEIVLKLSE